MNETRRIRNSPSSTRPHLSRSSAPDSVLEIKLSIFLKALGDPVRAGIIRALAHEPGGEIGATGISDMFTQSAPAVSHHLKILRDVGLVTSRREGVRVYYRLSVERITEVALLLAEIGIVMEPHDKPDADEIPHQGI